MAEINPEPIFNALVGRWSISRIYKGVGIPNGEATLSGRAEFSKIDGKDNVLLYEEFGELVVGDQSLETEQRYLYSYDPVEEKIKKWFFGQEEERFFHDVSFSKDYSKAQGSHKCGEDFYRADYVFKEGLLQSLKYAVTSSSEQRISRQKDYVIETAFTPQNV